jgi:hypothetical protein
MRSLRRHGGLRFGTDLPSLQVRDQLHRGRDAVRLSGGNILSERSLRHVRRRHHVRRAPNDVSLPGAALDLCRLPDEHRLPWCDAGLRSRDLLLRPVRGHVRLLYIGSVLQSGHRTVRLELIDVSDIRFAQDRGTRPPARDPPRSAFASADALATAGFARRPR